MRSFRFDCLQEDPKTRARLGKVTTAHSVIETPVFMPVGTNATVKTLDASDLESMGVSIMLSNAFHNTLRPGDELIARHGGLHGFMNWKRSILTDSGGFQVFSLANIRKINEEGVRFRSPLDGSEIYWTPERVMQIEANLGSDIMMPLDHCPALPADESQVLTATERTLKWLDRTIAARPQTDQALFGIVQGGVSETLRRFSAKETIGRDLDGYAIGGLSVGEEKRAMYDAIDVVSPELPKSKPRYLMGVGTPLDLIEAVSRGIDMFDCVMPTRNARNGTLFTSTGKLNIKRAEFRDDAKPLDENCICLACRTHSRAYLHHLFRADELLALRLNTLHNVQFYLSWMAQIRKALSQGTFAELLAKARDSLTSSGSVG